MSSTLDHLIAIVGNAAQRLGIKYVAIVAQDPATNEIRLVASLDANGSATPTMGTLRGAVGEKFGFAEDESETSWA